MSNNQYDIGVVVNYFWRPSYPKSSQESTSTSILHLIETNSVNRVILVDGSPIPDNYIQSKCQQFDIEYYTKGRNLNYADGFNTGIQLLNNEYVCLMASDIYASKDIFDKLYHWISTPDVGCVFPYLSFSDYPGQVNSFVRNPVTCEPSCMTLNLNLFKKEALEKIGGINENYSGSYNDVIALASIRQRGYRVILVGETNVNHIGRVTITQGSNYRKHEDNELFNKEYSHFRARHGKWQYKHWIKPFAVNRTIAAFWYIAQNAPSTRTRKFWEWLTIWLEPELTRIKNTTI